VVELCILYHFHAADEITLQHFELLLSPGEQAGLELVPARGAEQAAGGDRPFAGGVVPYASARARALGRTRHAESLQAEPETGVKNE